MRELMFFIPGPPRGKGRPRATVNHGRPTMYTDGKTAAYENLVRIACHQAMRKEGAEAMTGPIRLMLDIRMPIPASLSKKKQEELCGTPHTKKPDTSNILKAVEDGCNGVAWADDAQIWSGSQWKVYGKEPGVAVTIEETEETLAWTSQ